MRGVIYYLSPGTVALRFILVFLRTVPTVNTCFTRIKKNLITVQVISCNGRNIVIKSIQLIALTNPIAHYLLDSPQRGVMGYPQDFRNWRAHAITAGRAREGPETEETP